MEDTILIVDDSTYIVDGLTALLKRRGFHPLSANGGEEAVALLTTARPDLILLDIMMEPMDGWETLDRIKANPETMDIPVLMFSAKKITAEEAKDHCLNIDDFVSKPVNPVQLLESIRKIFQRRCDVKMESVIAQDAGLDSVVIDEYAALRKSIDVDKNLLEVLKNSRGLNTPGREVTTEDREAVRKLEEKISSDEKRLKEINEKFNRIV